MNVSLSRGSDASRRNAFLFTRLAPQGLVTGEYATHGTEVLSLSLGIGDDTGSMPLAGLRLEALKLIGDPNVPGGRYVQLQ